MAAIGSMSRYPFTIPVDTAPPFQLKQSPHKVRCISCEKFLTAHIVQTACGHLLHKSCYRNEALRSEPCRYCWKSVTSDLPQSSFRTIATKKDLILSSARLINDTTLSLTQKKITVAVLTSECGVTRKLFYGASVPPNFFVNGVSLLYMCSERGSHTIAKLLIALKGDPNIKNNLSCMAGWNPFWNELDFKREHGETPVFGAAKKGHLAVLHVLQQAGASMDCADPLGRTPLWHALEHENPASALTLVWYGAKPDVRLKNNDSALMWAFKKQEMGLAKALSQHGAKMTPDEIRFCLEAGARHSTRQLEFILAYGGIQFINEGPLPPVLVALIEGRSDNLQLLIKKGANLSVQVENKDLVTYAVRHLIERFQAYQRGELGEVRDKLKKFIEALEFLIQAFRDKSMTLPPAEQTFTQFIADTETRTSLRLRARSVLQGA
jgi:ankyrin repeat protein